MTKSRTNDKGTMRFTGEENMHVELRGDRVLVGTRSQFAITQGQVHRLLVDGENVFDSDETSFTGLVELELNGRARDFVRRFRHILGAAGLTEE